jgi:hypothetical protein
MTPFQRRLAQRRPELRDRLAALGSYVSSTVVHVATGSKTVDDATFAQRRATCDTCPSRDPVRDACTKCGCSLTKTILGDKLRRATSTCPLNKWGKTT